MTSLAAIRHGPGLCPLDSGLASTCSGRQRRPSADARGAGNTINGNANSAGVSGGGNGQSIGTGEGIRLDYVNDLTGNPAGSGGFNVPANRDFVFADHYEVNGAAVSFGGINVGSAAARFTAKDDPDGDGNDAVGDGAVDHITSVAISFGGETKIVALASPFVNPVIVGGHSFTIDAQA